MTIFDELIYFKKKKMIEFFMKWVWISQTTHPQLSYKHIDNQGGHPHEPGGLLEVSSCNHTA